VLLTPNFYLKNLDDHLRGSFSAPGLQGFRSNKYALTASVSLCELSSVVNKVTRLVELSPIKSLFPLVTFIKFALIAQIFWLHFSTVKVAHKFKKNLLGHIFGAIFSRTHLVTLVVKSTKWLIPLAPVRLIFLAILFFCNSFKTFLWFVIDEI
jgi:hypothetical protein